VSGGPWAKLANGTRLYGTARSSCVGAGRDQAHARSRLATAVDVGATGRGSPRRHRRNVQRRFSLSLLHHRIGEEEGDGVRLLVVVGASDALDCCSWRRLVAAQRGMSVRLRQTGRPVARVKRDAISSYISSLLLRIKIPSTPSRIIWSTTESG
jgi:hypothetical protein